MSEAKKEMNPSEYFQMLKEKKNHVTDEDLSRIYENCLQLLNKYKITGQTKAMRKLIFHLETIEKERQIVAAGITVFVYREDIEEYIDNISKDTVKIIELENYEREIPDEVVTALEKVKGKFDKFYVLFTDYTGKMERQIEKERRARDPILFGTFQDAHSQTVIERFYFIGDWEDEYCDLTLDKMVNQVRTTKSKNVDMKIKTPQDLQQLKEQLRSLERIGGHDEDSDMFRMVTKKPGIFKKVKTFVFGS